MEPLERLLGEAHDGRIQVPEFQRELILKDEWMRSLLASVSLGYPIGAVTLLEAGSREMRFETTPIADPPLSSRKPERLLIDGRRRITGLYQALASGRAVQIRDSADEPAQRWYSSTSSLASIRVLIATRRSSRYPTPAAPSQSGSNPCSRSAWCSAPRRSDRVGSTDSPGTEAPRLPEAG